MKNVRRSVISAICLMLCAALLLLGAGCGEKSAARLRFSYPEEYDKLATTCVAENSRYSLIWNAESKRVILYDKAKHCEWSYVPYELLNPSYDEEGFEANIHPKIESPVVVNFFDSSTNAENEAVSMAQSIKSGNFTLRAIENGVEMELYFERYEFSVPVSFTLTDTGMDISVDPDRIKENSDFCIYSIVIAPFFCSVSNNYSNTDGHYLFVPSGSGALLYPEYTDGVGIASSESIYGDDANIVKEEQTTVTESVRLPVFGAVNGDRGVCAIVKDGAESAFINTMMGQSLTGYSNIYAEFRIRGYQEAIQKLFTKSVVKTNLYADAFIPDKITVGFSPLYDDEASYVGMAEKYREYLAEKGQLSAEKSNDTLLNLKFYGGIQSKKFTFGIPSTTIISATTINQAYDIVNDLKDRTGLDAMNVNLIGFGASANDIGVVAGNYKIADAFGDGDDLEKFSQYCRDNGMNLFMNFDMVRFSSSGGGVSTTFGRADSANGSFTDLHYFSVNFRTNNTALRTYYLVAREKLAEVAENIKESAEDWKLTGVSLDTLTSIEYSDYRDLEYYSGANYDRQVSAIIHSFKADGYAVAGSDANGFAAAQCTHVYDVPVRSSQYRQFTVDVPFYEIVFKGHVSMSGASINLATNSAESLLFAVETGTGLTYTLVNEYDTNLISSGQNVFYGSVYWDEMIQRGVRDSLVETVAGYQDYFDSVNGAGIANHRIINENVRVTTFDNGVTVYVNYGDTEYTDGNITVPALGYTVKEA